MKYQKKPEFVDAVQWTGEAGRYREIKNMCDCGVHWWKDNSLGIYVGNYLTNVYPGDFVVKGTDGTINRCEKDAFEEMYEPLETVSCDEPIEDTLECEAISVEPCWQERLYHDCRAFNKLCEVRTGAWETIIKILKEAGAKDDEISECSQKIRTRELEFRYKTLREILGKIEGVEL